MYSIVLHVYNTLLKYVLFSASLESWHDISLSVSARVERDFQCFAISERTIFFSSSSLLIAITTSNAFLLVFKSTVSGIQLWNISQLCF